MAGFVVSSVAQSIGNLLLEEGKFLHGVPGKVRGIQTQLNRMQRFLKDADTRHNENEVIRNWVAEVRDAAYDAEDVIETFALEEASRRRPGMMNVLKRFVCILSEGKALHKVGSEIEAINARITDLIGSLQTLGLKEARDNESSSSTYQRRQRLRRSYSHIVEQNIVGLEGSIKVLVDRIVKEKWCRVVSICGMGGLGKTTLAKKVYGHADVRRHFDCFAWSCVSKQFRPRDVWQGVLIKLTSPSEKQRVEILNLLEEELAKRLYQLQQHKKCLVVLDDVWDKQAWDSLKAAFPSGETESKILLTGRNKDIAEHGGRSGFLHEPRCLNDEESWELLQKIAIPPKDAAADFRIETEMEELGKKMAKHCAGLPLAITVLGGLLATKSYTLDQWLLVNENIKSYIGRGKNNKQNDSVISDIVLSLSYDDLPPHLKQCFLYLGHFPEDYEIQIEKLIRYWTAEGIVTSLHDEVENVAEGYLDELIERSMVLVGERDIGSSKVITCRMHDLMKDLCLLKAEEESFLKVINLQPQDENNDVLSPSSSMNDKFRRLAVHLKGNTFSQKHIKGHHHLRSLIYFSTNHWKLSEPTLKNLKVLRVLDLEWVLIKGGKIPKDIGELIHLRFLSLRRSSRPYTGGAYAGGVFELPSSLGNLRLLQTLDLTMVGVDVHVPNVIWKMEKLRYLYLPFHCDDKTKLQLGTLTKLWTLTNFNLEHCNVRDLLNMKSLRELVIELSSNSVDASLSVALNHLQILKLSGTPSSPAGVRLGLLSGFVNLSRLELNLHIEKLPEFPPHMTDITLCGCHLKEDPMPTLEKLPDLRILRLIAKAFIWREMVCSRQGFSRLHSLVLSGLPELVEWRIDEGAMPNLCKLVIGNCENLKRLPDNFWFITTLQELKIRYMPKTFKDNLVNRDFEKVQRIPSVLFVNRDEEYRFPWRCGQ